MNSERRVPRNEKNSGFGVDKDVEISDPSSETRIDAGTETKIEKRETKKEKGPKVPENKSLLEALNNLEDDKARAKFLGRFRGRKTHVFLKNEEGVKVLHYVRLKEGEEKSVSKTGELVFEVYDTYGDKVLDKDGKEMELVKDIKKIKFQNWKKAEPKPEELNKLALLRGSDGKLEKHLLEEIYADDLKNNEFIKEYNFGDNRFRSDEMVRYEDENGRVAYSASVEPRPESEDEKLEKDALSQKLYGLLDDCFDLCDENIRKFKDNNPKALLYFVSTLDKLKNYRAKVTTKIERLDVLRIKEDVQTLEEKYEEYLASVRKFEGEEAITKPKEEIIVKPEVEPETGAKVEASEFKINTKVTAKKVEKKKTFIGDIKSFFGDLRSEISADWKEAKEEFGQFKKDVAEIFSFGFWVPPSVKKEKEAVSLKRKLRDDGGNFKVPESVVAEKQEDASTPVIEIPESAFYPDAKAKDEVAKPEVKEPKSVPLPKVEETPPVMKKSEKIKPVAEKPSIRDEVPVVESRPIENEKSQLVAEIKDFLDIEDGDDFDIDYVKNELERLDKKYSIENKKNLTTKELKNFDKVNTFLDKMSKLAKGRAISEVVWEILTGEVVSTGEVLGDSEKKPVSVPTPNIEGLKVESKDESAEIKKLKDEILKLLSYDWQLDYGKVLKSDSRVREKTKEKIANHKRLKIAKEDLQKEADVNALREYLEQLKKEVNNRRR